MTSFSNIRGLKQSEVVRITGDDEAKAATVFEDPIDNKNRLAVDAKISGLVSGANSFPSVNNNYRIDVVQNEVIWPAGTSTLYTYTGTGYFFSFHIDSDNDKLECELLIDGVSIFGWVGVKFLKDLKFELSKNQIYQNKNLWCTDGDDLDFEPEYSIYFGTSVAIRIRRDDGNDVKIRRYFVQLVKES